MTGIPTTEIIGQSGNSSSVTCSPFLISSLALAILRRNLSASGFIAKPKPQLGLVHRSHHRIPAAYPPAGVTAVDVNP